MQRLQFLASQPWFDPSTDPWPCGGDELFAGQVTFELAGDNLRAAGAESRNVMIDFAAPLLGSRTQSQFRLALRNARPGVGSKRPRGETLNDSALFAQVSAAGSSLHGQLLHMQITRMSDNVQDGQAVPQPPFLRLEFGGVAVVLQPLPETPISTAVENLRSTVDAMLKALSPEGPAPVPVAPVAHGGTGAAHVSGVVSPSPSCVPVAQRVAHWQAFVRSSQALLEGLQQSSGGDAAARAAHVDDQLLAALPRCLAQAMESVAESAAAQSEREAHYAQHEQLYLQCAVRELSGKPTAETDTHGGTPGSAPRQAARDALERSYRALLAGSLLPGRSAGAAATAAATAARPTSVPGPAAPPQGTPLPRPGA